MTNMNVIERSRKSILLKLVSCGQSVTIKTKILKCLSLQLTLRCVIYLPKTNAFARAQPRQFQKLSKTVKCNCKGKIVFRNSHQRKCLTFLYFNCTFPTKITTDRPKIDSSIEIKCLIKFINQTWRSTMSSPRTGILLLIWLDSGQDQD